MPRVSVTQRTACGHNSINQLRRFDRKNPQCDVIDVLANNRTRRRNSCLARDYRKPMEIHGTAIRISSAINKAVRCGHTRPIATSGETRPIAHAA